MSEEINPDVHVTPDVVETKSTENTVAESVEPKVEETEVPVTEEEQTIGEAVGEIVDNVVEKAIELSDNVADYAGKTLAELTGLFQGLMEDVDRMKKSKQAEAIKSAFYKKLSKEKAEAGEDSVVEEPTEDSPIQEEQPEVKADETGVVNPFDAIEQGFKSLYTKYKEERSEYNKQQEKSREENLQLKQAVIEDLKALVEKQEDVNATFPEFRAIQARWREIGPVPAQNFRDLNDTYQFYVEKFYDMVKINRDLRDLDFKKNLEAKEEFCEQAEKLAENENVVDAFRELQKLHEQWKEYGPVAKEFRDSIWDRFKAATAVINKKYQAYFEDQKSKQTENLAAKTALCEQVEALADKEIKSSNEWNEVSKQIMEIQKQWRSIGFATKKENQKIYDRFRAACDKFFGRKREFYTEYKDSMSSNMEKKLDIIAQAEALKESTDWKKTTDQLINLQKQWKEIGAVPRKKSEQLWKRFRAACDAFFNERDKNVKPENDYYGNLKAKKALVEEISAYEVSDDSAANDEAMNAFAAKWQGIGFVPFKEKDNIVKAYEEAMKAKFPQFSVKGSKSSSRGGSRSAQKAPRSEKDRLVARYNQLQQDIDTYENNIGFFAMSKNAESLLKQMHEKIDQSKKELKNLEDQIRKLDESETADQN